MRGVIVCVLLIAFPWLALSQELTHGTSAAIIQTDTEIAIAADSRVVDYLDNPQKDICKIQSAGELHFVVIGADFVDLRGFFETVLADRATTIREKFNKIISSPAVANKIISAGSDTGFRTKLTENGGAVFTLIVFGIDNGELSVGTLLFSGPLDMLAPMTLRNDQSICPPECSALPPPTRYAAGTPREDVNSRLDISKPPATAVRNFVQYEIDKGLPTIGPPLALLRIGREGHVEWLEKPDVCKDQD